MRLELQLECNLKSVLPFNYEYALSAWIYQILSDADNDFATFLHDTGYQSTQRDKTFKLFTFSKILLEKPFQTDKYRGFILNGGRARLELSFLIDKAMQEFVVGLFKSQQLSIRIKGGRIDFKVIGIQVLPEPEFHPIMTFKAIKPIFMSKNVEGVKYSVYISPDDGDYSRLFFNNLLDKADALGMPSIDSVLEFRCLTPPRSKLFHIDGTQIRAFEYEFIIAAPVELMRIGYYSGFGGKNSSLGLGFCVKKQ
jgi:CRISPR-associated endoribonuclease Cas6